MSISRRRILTSLSGAIALGVSSPLEAQLAKQEILTTTKLFSAMSSFYINTDSDSGPHTIVADSVDAISRKYGKEFALNMFRSIRDASSYAIGRIGFLQEKENV